MMRDQHLDFVKMHGIGNDYVYVDAWTDPSPEQLNLPRLAMAMSNRHTGVGSDGLILVCRPSEPARRMDAHARMRMFNADGSEGEMCGNGIRCVAKFAHDRLGINARPMRIESGRGILSIDYELADGKLSLATVDMGEPIFELAAMGIQENRLAGRATDRAWRVPLDDGSVYEAILLSTGNPHAVIFADDVASIDLAAIGPRLERHPAFTQRANIHFVKVESPDEATMRTWERGSGITLACGTGASAVLVASHVTGRLSRRALIHLPGGDLIIRWDETTNHVYMTGPAEESFQGCWPGPF